jgi:hypothetical protein
MEYEQLGGSLHSHFIEVACMTQHSQPPDFAFHSSEEYPRLHHAVPLLYRPYICHCTDFNALSEKSLSLNPFRNL